MMSQQRYGHARSMRRLNGFTLIELIAVVVIIGIIAGLGSGFLISTLNSYDQVQNRAKLLGRGRVILEYIGRQVRQAAPHSLRVSASGNCIEYLPLIGGGSYIEDLPDGTNGMAPSNTVATYPFFVEASTAQFALVGALSRDDVYATDAVNSRAQVASVNGQEVTNITLISPHRFVRNSLVHRVFLTTSPKKLCLAGGVLTMYSNYGFSTSPLTDGDPGGSTAIVARNLSAGPSIFSISSGSQDRGMNLMIDFNILQKDQQVNLREQVLVKNVP